MKKDNVVERIQLGEFKDHLTEVLSQGGQNNTCLMKKEYLFNI